MITDIIIDNQYGYDQAINPMPKKVVAASTIDSVADTTAETPDTIFAVRAPIVGFDWR